MLAQALFLASADLRLMFRARETWLWGFVMPVVFFYFIGTVTAGFGRPAAPESIAIHEPADAGFLASRIASRLEQSGYRVIRVPDASALAAHDRRLSFPAGFTQAVIARQAPKVSFSYASPGANADYDQVRVARAVYAVLAEYLAATRDGAPATAASLDAISSRPVTLSVVTETAGRRKTAPIGFEQSVPGTMVMFTLLVLFTSGAATLTIERNRGILRRLASTSMPRASVVLGKFGARFALGAIQIAFAMLTGALLFKVAWGPALPAVLVVLAAYAALAAALGLALGNFGRTEAQVTALGVGLTNTLAALGGCWWPIEVAPIWAQKLSVFLPTGLAMDALHKLVSFHHPAISVAPHAAVLTLAAVAVLFLLVKRFRFQ